jgi:hypothetical protein
MDTAQNTLEHTGFAGLEGFAADPSSIEAKVSNIRSRNAEKSNSVGNPLTAASSISGPDGHKRAVPQKRGSNREGNGRWVIFGILAAVWFVPIILNLQSHPGPVHQPTWATTVDPKIETSSIGDTSELVPAVGTGRSFSRGEIRYCLFQGERIDAAGLSVDQSSAWQVDAFNQIAADYNSRCNRFRYRQSDMDAVTAELAEKRDQLAHDGRRLIFQ